jgi:hypothetical protein
MSQNKFWVWWERAHSNASLQVGGIRVVVIVLLLLLTACGKLAPANLPAQLENTPGAPIMITTDYYETEVFRLRYPDGWRVVTSASSLPPSVIFASPDETSLIIVSSEPFDVLPNPLVVEEGTSLRELENSVMTDTDNPVYVALIAPEAQWNAMTTLFALVIATLE